MCTEEGSPPDWQRRELIHRIALTLAPSIGPITARKLIDKLGSAGAVLSRDRKSLERIKGIGPRLSGAINAPLLLEQAEKELAFIERHRIGSLFFMDPGYPERLNLCPDGPILLFCRGNLEMNNRMILSVVGTRRATSYGRDICRRIICDLAEKLEGLVIVSGLAYGIDVIAHRAALDYGLPTVAVLGHGLQTIYPPAHRDVARRIMEQGALVTDFPSGTGPERNHFIRRNRIIAGISAATLVIESGPSGGALITADLAASYDREVLAVPGRAGDTRSAGCNALIKSNAAALVESADDIIYLMKWAERSGPPGRPALSGELPSGEERLILDHLRQKPGSDPGYLSTATSIPIHRVLSLLLQMELKEWVHTGPGNAYHAGYV